MKKMEKGTLRSGGSGKKVTNPKQAIAIGLSEAKKKGAKVPAKKKAATKKPAAKKAASKKAAVKRSPVKKAAVKKSAPKKAAAKKPAAKKAPVKKAASKPASSAARKPVAKKVTPQKVKPTDAPSKEQLPPKSELSEEMHEEAVHEEKQTQPITQSDHTAELMEKKEDPIMAFDMHMAQKATSKGDRNNKMRVSSTGQRPMRPSGKKPLWRK